MINDIVLMDGAVGTSLWEKTDNKVEPWRYNIENPSIVAELHQEFLSAGAKIILANTFGANALNVGKASYTVDEVIKNALNLIKPVCMNKAKIALGVGPLSELLEPYGDLTEQRAYEIYDEQISSGVKYGADIIYIQTFMDLNLMKVALKASEKYNKPTFCSFSFDKKGRTMMGNSVRDIVEGLKAYKVDAVGLNCSLGPDAAMPVIKEFHQLTDLPLIFKPNAGQSTLRGEETVTEYSPEMFVRDSLPALEYGVKYIGGCCGTNAQFIKALSAAIENLKSSI